MMYVWLLMPQYTHGGQRKILHDWFFSYLHVASKVRI